MHEIDWNIDYPLIPLRNMVVFPGIVVPLYIGREKSLSALQQAQQTAPQRIVLLTQKDPDNENPQDEDFYQVGVLVDLIQVLQMPEGSTKILVEGRERVELQSWTEHAPCARVRVAPYPYDDAHDPALKTLCQNALQKFETFAKFQKAVPSETLVAMMNLEDPQRVATMMSSYLNMSAPEKQELLEAVLLKDVFARLMQQCEKQLHSLELDKDLHFKVKNKIEKAQKEFFLKEKLKMIREELGEKEGQETEEYREKLEKLAMPPYAQKLALRELDRLSKLSTVSAEAGVIRTYLDWLVEMPWNAASADHVDIAEVSKRLEEDHYGLEKVKDRILEYFAVLQLTQKVQGSIICLVGPPGVGKTSVARSIANAMNRTFVRISLGGIRDEAELRGHRRTYVGALPGRFVKAMHKASVNNPVILLDEIDKLSEIYKGDPTGVLLEVLDPEQNNEFTDHYLEVPFDFSKVLFIATANSLQKIERPLLDRLEVITLSGYTEEDKLEIARRYLIPKQLNKQGIPAGTLTFTEEGLRLMIREYTRELGLRNLDRTLAELCRKTAKAIIEKHAMPIEVDLPVLREFLGKQKFLPDKIDEQNTVGLVTGLAWTQSGGDTLPVEVAVVRGRGRLTLTGQLGEVMQESAQAALSYIRSRSEALNIDEGFYRKYDIHIHVSEGAIPKDGPSAGIAMATAMVSALTGIPIKRDVAMTGEITLRGRVLPIGGLREKVMAAALAGIKTIILPKDNEKDLDDIPKQVRSALTYVCAENMDQVLKVALAVPDQPLELIPDDLAAPRAENETVVN